jgi:hypothetical protein
LLIFVLQELRPNAIKTMMIIDLFILINPGIKIGNYCTKRSRSALFHGLPYLRIYRFLIFQSTEATASIVLLVKLD